MKKLLGIVVLGLLLSGNAYAQLITLKKCYTVNFKSSDGRKAPTYKSFEDSQRINNDLDDQLYTLDTVTETITFTMVNSQIAIDEWFEVHKKILPKIIKETYKIIDLGGNVATAIPAKKQDWVKEEKIDVDFENAKVYFYMTSDIGAGENTVSSTQQCTKQK